MTRLIDADRLLSVLNAEQSAHETAALTAKLDPNNDPFVEAYRHIRDIVEAMADKADGENKAREWQRERVG